MEEGPRIASLLSWLFSKLLVPRFLDGTWSVFPDLSIYGLNAVDRRRDALIPSGISCFSWDFLIHFLTGALYLRDAGDTF